MLINCELYEKTIFYPRFVTRNDC
ncbi:MAG: hypothetical protein RLY85_1806, partial [Bacteroidota bacterium]